MYIDPPKPGRAMFRTGFGYGATLPHHDPDAVRIQRALMSDHQIEMEHEMNRRAEKREQIMAAVVVVCSVAGMAAGLYAHEIGRFLAPYLGVA